MKLAAWLFASLMAFACGVASAYGTVSHAPGGSSCVAEWADSIGGVYSQGDPFVGYAARLGAQNYGGSPNWTCSPSASSAQTVTCSSGQSVTTPPINFFCTSANPYGGQFYGRFYYRGAVVPTPPACPSNSTSAAGVCTCNPNFKSAGAECVPYTCGALGSTVSSNTTTRYDMPASGTTICFDGCTATPEWQYGTGSNRWATGPWYSTGGVCEGSTVATGGAEPAPAPAPAGSAPQSNADCDPGWCWGTAAGLAACVRCPTTVTDVTSTSSTSASGVTTSGPSTTVRTTQNPDGSSTTTTTTTNPDGSTTTTTSTGPAGGEVGDYCRLNPTAAMCSTAGGDGEGTGEEEEPEPCTVNPSQAGCGGDPTPASSLYSEKAKTFQTVLTNFRTGINATALGSGASGFFTVAGGGTCPTWTIVIPYIDATVPFDFWCAAWASQALSLMGAALMVVAGFFSFRVAFE